MNKPKSKQTRNGGESESVFAPHRSWVQKYRSWDPFPATALRRLSYANAIQLTTSATIATLGTEAQFRLNSAFDPEVVAGNGQPYGFDQMAALYAKYKVHRATLTVTVPARISASDITSFALGMQILPSGNPGGSLSGVAVGTASMQTNTQVVCCSMADPTVSRSSWNMAEIEGITDLQFKANVEEYAAAVSADPSRVITLNLAVANMCAAVAINTRVLVQIDFDVEFFDRITLAAS